MENSLATLPETVGNGNFLAPIDLFNVEQFNQMQRVCKSLVYSSILPKRYCVSKDVTEIQAIANCMIAFNMSRRMGVDMITVAQSLHIINGTPSWSAQFVTSLVNTSGKFTELKYRFWNDGKVGSGSYLKKEGWGDKQTTKMVPFDYPDMDNMTCEAYAWYVGDEKTEENKVISEKISIRTAMERGWWHKENSSWPSIPKQMCMYRTGAFFQRAYIPQIGLGLRTAEEERDIIDVEHEEVVDDKIKAKAGSKAVNITPEPDPVVTPTASSVDPGTGQPDPTVTKADPDPAASTVVDNDPPISTAPTPTETATPTQVTRRFGGNRSR